MARPFAQFLIFVIAVVQPVSAAGDVGDAGSSRKLAIQTDESEIRVLVYRAGLLGGLGHNHVVSAASISGNVALSSAIGGSSVELEFAVDDLLVDPPAAREEEGDDFPGAVPDKDIRGTRKNMLGRKLLDAENFPVIRIASESVSGILPALEIAARVTLRDEEFVLTFPATVDVGEASVAATGEFDLAHADVGLKPFSAAFGTLKVAKVMTIKFHIVAQDGQRQSGK